MGTEIPTILADASTMLNSASITATMVIRDLFNMAGWMWDL